MCLYFVSMNGVARSEEVVTKPTLHVSCCISILCITLTKDAMLEIAQVLDVHEVLGCFHHLLYTVASSILQFATILCPPSLARMRHRCRHRLSLIFGLTAVCPMIEDVCCLYPTNERSGNISTWKPIHPAYTKPLPSVSCFSTAFLYHLR